MKKVTIDRIQIGDCVAADVKDRFGRLLIHKGVTIEAKHIIGLKAWGVLSLKIESEAEPVSDELSNSERLLICQKRVKERLKLNDANHPFIANIYKAILELEVMKDSH